MKKMICGAWLLVAVATVSAAQTAQKQAAKKQAVKNTAQAKKSNKKQSTTKAANHTAQLVSINSSKAYGVKKPVPQFQISDPVVKTLNERAAAGTAVNVNTRMTGVPRGTYGIANGRLTLMPADARSSGTFTGSGAVGTGTSIGIMGTQGPAMSVNGKNTYSGPGIYGAAGIGSGLKLNDSTLRTPVAK